MVAEKQVEYVGGSKTNKLNMYTFDVDGAIIEQYVVKILGVRIPARYC